MRMATPSYEAFMMPALQALLGVEAAQVHDLAPSVQSRMGLADDVCTETLPWSRQPVLLARLESALRDLREAQLVRMDSGSAYALTARGQALLGPDAPAAIDVAFLGQFEEFAAYRAQFSKRRGA